MLVYLYGDHLGILVATTNIIRVYYAQEFPLVLVCVCVCVCVLLIAHMLH